jgi:hypothetical protein
MSFLPHFNRRQYLSPLQLSNSDSAHRTKDTEEMPFTGSEYDTGPPFLPRRCLVKAPSILSSHYYFIMHHKLNHLALTVRFKDGRELCSLTGVLKEGLLTARQ